MSEQAVDLLDKLIMQKELPRGTEALPRGWVEIFMTLLFFWRYHHRLSHIPRPLPKSLSQEGGESQGAPLHAQ